MFSRPVTLHSPAHTHCQTKARQREVRGRKKPSQHTFYSKSLACSWDPSAKRVAFLGGLLDSSRNLTGQKGYAYDVTREQRNVTEPRAAPCLRP